MNCRIELTEDGSTTFFSDRFGQHYHSIHGAIQESIHVFIEAGYRCVADKPHVTVFEMGFGTGLNALLTKIEADRLRQLVSYFSVELYPISTDEACAANYSEQLGLSDDSFKRIHAAPWGETILLSEHFTLTKINGDLLTLALPSGVDLVYFDAFDQEAQPDLWSEHVFRKIYEAMTPNGILVTYSSKGVVKEALRAAGFFVQRLAGPPGKRHMVRAIKQQVNE